LGFKKTRAEIIIMFVGQFVRDYLAARRDGDSVREAVGYAWSPTIGRRFLYCMSKRPDVEYDPRGRSNPDELPQASLISQALAAGLIKEE
jgi:hypothetical protein